MKIDVIVPSNNPEEINGFIKSFSSMSIFKDYCQLVIIGNGDLKQSNIKYINSVSIKFIRIDEDYTEKLVPFAKLRGKGMINSNADYFLFMDDDNRFPERSNYYFIDCINFLERKKNCSVLQADRDRFNYYGPKLKEDGFYWTGYGLFIKNLPFSYKDFLNFEGCCEETLYVYEALNIGGLAYTFYGNPTIRDTSKQPKWNEENNPSYNEKVIQNNIQGFIQEKYQDKYWRYYDNIPNNKLPNLLQKKMDERIKNEK